MRALEPTPAMRPTDPPFDPMCAFAHPAEMTLNR